MIKETVVADASRDDDDDDDEAARQDKSRIGREDEGKAERRWRLLFTLWVEE